MIASIAPSMHSIICPTSNNTGEIPETQNNVLRSFIAKNKVRLLTTSSSLQQKYCGGVPLQALVQHTGLCQQSPYRTRAPIQSRLSQSAPPPVLCSSSPHHHHSSREGSDMREDLCNMAYYSPSSGEGWLVTAFAVISARDRHQPLLLIVTAKEEEFEGGGHRTKNSFSRPTVSHRGHLSVWTLLNLCFSLYLSVAHCSVDIVV